LFAAELGRFFRRQAEVVTAKLKGPKSLKGTRHWRGKAIERKVSGADIFDKAMWNRELRKAIEPVFVLAVQQAGQEVLDVFVNDPAGDGTKASRAARAVERAAETRPAALAFDVHDPAVTDLIRARVAQWNAVNATTADKVARAVSAGDAAGETIPQIAARVQTAIRGASDSRATLIARTETGIAHNGAQLIAAEQSGVIGDKEWLAVGDHRTRETHLDIDGTTVALDETFSVGDYDMNGPGDPNAGAEEVVNCRCVLLFHPGDGGGTTIVSEGDDGE
jgi:hypothetical protein